MHLPIIAPDGRGSEVVLTTPIIRLGRDPPCEVHFDPDISPIVSGQHAAWSQARTLAGLDEQTDQQMMELFREIDDSGKTVVCITHNLANVEATCHLAGLCRRAAVNPLASGQGRQGLTNEEDRAQNGLLRWIMPIPRKNARRDG